MNPSKSPEDIVKGIFPILVVLIILIAGVIFMPSLTADPRSRASEFKPAILTPTSTAKPRPTFPPQNNSIKPEIICSDLYKPVCDQNTGTTYPNECEAELAKVTSTTKGECGKDSTSPISLPSSN